MTKERLQIGKKGEDLALRKMKQLGYQCIARNFRCNIGEIDLIARDGDCLVFVEIKTRRGKSTGYAKEAIDVRKRKKLSQVALAYLKAHDCMNVKSRFDVVAINLQGREKEIEIIKNAFELAC